MAKILVVDDEKSIRFLLTEILRKEGHNVATAADGSDACKYLKTERFDLVLTDLHMSNKGGIDVLKSAKKNDPFLEVLILTAHGSISSAVEAMQLGAFEYLTKPLNLKEFRVKVKQALELRRMRQKISQQQAELQAHQEMIAKDLKLASQVQESLVPKSNSTDRYEIAVRYAPMIGVGGDFSDIYYTETNDIYTTIVDVTGHGIASALLVNRTCMEIRRLVREQLEPVEILHQLNDFIIDSFMGTGMFLTMFSCVLNLDSGKFRYAGSSHPAIILWRDKKRDFDMLESQNPIIGFDRSERNTFEQSEAVIEPGDKLLLYTDGIIEVENEKNEQLGIGGVMQLVRSAASGSAAVIADKVISGMRDFVKKTQRDDIYLIALNLKQEGKSDVET